MSEGEDDLGWVQIQQKSLMWEEKIGDFSVITHEGLTTLAHSAKMGWTITSGTWNHLRETWDPSPTTLTKIQESCKSQECLEESNRLTPTRRILLTLKETWNLSVLEGFVVCTDYRQLLHLSSSPQSRKTRSTDGGQGTQKQYMCGTPWMIRTNRSL